jgi:hypothetical protein
MDCLKVKLKKMQRTKNKLKFRLALMKLKNEGATEAKRLALVALDLAVQSADRLEEHKNKEISYLQMDLLRAKGLLSSRGIFERFLQNIQFEHSAFTKKIDATATCVLIDKITTGTFN